MQDTDLERALGLARDIARSVRSKLMSQYGNIEALSKNDGDVATSVVTELDREIEHIFREKLLDFSVEVGFYGEETGRSGRKDLFWLVDPLDGTNYYIRGLPMCSSMISLIDNGQVVLAVIYDFLEDDVYSAIRGGGAFVNDQLISVSERSLANSLVTFESSLAQPPLLEHLRGNASLVSYRASGYESILVASGKIEAKIGIEAFGGDWDYAPGSLLVEEAGGVVVNLGQSSYDYRNHSFIMSNKEFYKDIVAREYLL